MLVPLLLIVLAQAAPPPPPPRPSFESFPAGQVYRGTPAAPRFRTAAQRRFRTRIRECAR